MLLGLEKYTLQSCSRMTCPEKRPNFQTLSVVQTSKLYQMSGKTSKLPNSISQLEYQEVRTDRVVTLRVGGGGLGLSIFLSAFCYPQTAFCYPTGCGHTCTSRQLLEQVQAPVLSSLMCGLSACGWRTFCLCLFVKRLTPNCKATDCVSL